MKVLLLCTQGMSTSMLVEAMYRCAEEEDIIEAINVDIVRQCIDEYDVILLGPQIRYKLDEIKTLAKPYHKAVAMVDMRAYGQMDGAFVYKQAKELLKQSM